MFELSYLSWIFYALSAAVLACTLLAVTRSSPAHAVVYLIGSFLGTALLFLLLGAPLPAAFEVILYAGAFMVLFLFVITMLGAKPGRQRKKVLQWSAPAGLAAVSLAALFTLFGQGANGRTPLPAAVAQPAVFGRVLFERYWFAVEVASFLLFVGLVGVLYLGRKRAVPQSPPAEGKG